MNKNNYKTFKQDNNSISCYFKSKWQMFYADLSNIYNLFNEFMVFRCNGNWVVNYSLAVFVMQTDSLTECEVVDWIEKFKKRFRKRN